MQYGYSKIKYNAVHIRKTVICSALLCSKVEYNKNRRVKSSTVNFSKICTDKYNAVQYCTVKQSIFVQLSTESQSKKLQCIKKCSIVQQNTKEDRSTVECNAVKKLLYSRVYYSAVKFKQSRVQLSQPQQFSALKSKDIFHAPENLYISWGVNCSHAYFSKIESYLRTGVVLGKQISGQI